ncbi:NAD-dependent protein deacetylase Sir2B-like [Condylostylus longicornis]|uniref:NAD-dependent protein deacetylase Sir2B-like n=1 Tax=Condylostylus longicornis TaxID=2530218 RepID=UPI00244DA410|nr:NAD-dependent protein deacetylase Sir2B-like [Condylostylus longicornis]
MSIKISCDPYENSLFSISLSPRRDVAKKRLRSSSLLLSSTITRTITTTSLSSLISTRKSTLLSSLSLSSTSPSTSTILIQFDLSAISLSSLLLLSSLTKTTATSSKNRKKIIIIKLLKILQKIINNEIKKILIIKLCKKTNNIDNEIIIKNFCINNITFQLLKYYNNDGVQNYYNYYYDKLKKSIYIKKHINEKYQKHYHQFKYIIKFKEQIIFIIINNSNYNEYNNNHKILNIIQLVNNISYTAKIQANKYIYTINNNNINNKQNIDIKMPVLLSSSTSSLSNPLQITTGMTTTSKNITKTSTFINNNIIKSKIYFLILPSISLLLSLSSFTLILLLIILLNNNRYNNIAIIVIKFNNTLIKNLNGNILNKSTKIIKILLLNINYKKLIKIKFQQKQNQLQLKKQPEQYNSQLYHQNYQKHQNQIRLVYNEIKFHQKCGKEKFNNNNNNTNKRTLFKKYNNIQNNDYNNNGNNNNNINKNNDNKQNNDNINTTNSKNKNNNYSLDIHNNSNLKIENPKRYLIVVAALLVTLIVISVKL